MAVNDRYSVTPIVDLADVRAVMVHNFLISSEIGAGAGAQSIADFFSNLLGPLIKTMIPPNATYRGVRVQKYYPKPPDMARVSTVEAGVGLSTVEVLSPQSAGLITWRTLKAGRGFRGRSYMPFPSEGANDVNGRPNFGYQQALDGYAVALEAQHTIGAGGDTSTLILILQSKVFTVDYTPVTTHVVRDYWGTIRRRSRAQGTDVTGPL